MSLQGRCVIVTRPPHQAEPLCNALEQAGAKAIRLPLIDIEPVSSPEFAGGSSYDWIIFTSPNAVHLGVDVLEQISNQPRLAAVGAATALALHNAGQSNVLYPQDEYSSEGLLDALAGEKLKQQRFLIIKGQGGRQLLADALAQRGAEVEELAVYRRVPVDPDPAQIRRAVEQADSMIVTSAEILLQLHQQTPPDAQTRLHSLQLVVPSARVVKRAAELGFDHVHCVESPLTEAALLHALQTRQQP